MVFWVWLIVALMLGSVIGCWGMRLFMQQRHVGTLREDRSDPNEAPYLFLELDPDGMQKIHRYKAVTLRVRIENYIPSSRK